MGRAKELGRLRALLVALAALSLSALIPAFASAAVNPQYLKSFGPDGTSSTFFEELEAIAVDEGTEVVYVGDWKKQVLYKFDSEGNPLNWGGSEPYIKGNEITGLSFFAHPGHNQVAVDPETHVIYVTSDNKVRAFEPNGEPHKFTEGPGAGTSELPAATTELGGVAVDAKGNIYASDIGRQKSNPKVRIHSRSGAPLTEFEPKLAGGGTANPATLSVAPDGNLYVVSFETRAYRLKPSQFPVTTSTTYAPGVLINNGFTLSVALDPATNDVYVGERVSTPGQIEQPGRVGVYDEDDNPVGSLGAPGRGGNSQAKQTHGA